MDADHYAIAGLRLRDHELELPLDHDAPDGERLTVFAREVVAAERARDELPWLVFLQGGPGFGAPRPAARSGWLERAVKEFRVLLLDQRGTGRSSAVSFQSMAGVGDAAAQAAWLRHFRADAIVQDCEAFRRELLATGERWTVLGQSYGGFCALHYLSAAPEALRGVLVTGGLPPLSAHPDEIYRRTYALVAERNRRLYAQFPAAAERARRIVDRLARGDVRLPDGDLLSPRRFQQLGLLLGFREGPEQLAYLLEEAFVPGSTDEVSYGFLRGFQNALAYDTNPIFSLLHEACYAQGFATRWSAQRVRPEFPEFAAERDGPPFFTGEMIYPWQFDELSTLRPLKDAAELLAAHEDWPPLYDPEVLAGNDVPCAAAVYHDDMYVERGYSLETAAAVRGLVPWVTNEHEHNALRLNGGDVLERLLELLRR